MPRYKLTIEYDGTDFAGWQRQDGPISVQQVLEESVFKFSGEEVTLHVAGRTDSGVHALGQVAHFDLVKEFPEKTVRNALNFHSRPHLLSVLKAEKVSEEFHARFGAVKRHYRYIICNRRPPPAIGSKYAWHVPYTLDLELMQKAADVLVGHHDFTSFRATVCQAKSPVKTIDRITIMRHGDQVFIDVTAPSFLHHQIRNIVGTLKKIAEGRWPPDCMPEILEARDRTRAGPTAPPGGLFFVRVDYTATGNT
jgi:tRNA pseudouridine38-40 synthase